MKKKFSLFKNDPFGIKQMIFDKKIHWLRIRSIKLYLSCMKNYQLILYKIGIPKTEQEIKIVKKILNDYDECLNKLEKNLKYTRLYVNDFEKESKTESIH